MRHTLFISLILIFSTLAVYGQVRNHDFVNLDDPQYITENHRVQEGISLESVVWAFTTTHAANWHPLTWLSHMLDCELYGLNPGGHHLTNLLFHLANTLLLFIVLKRMTGAYWRSAFVAALFALHPLHVESVAWTAERKDVLSTFFWILTLWNYVRYVEQPGFKRYLLVIFTFTLGLMAKPMLVTLPFVLLLLDYWPLNRYLLARSGRGNNEAIQAPIDPGRSRSSARGLVLEKAPLFALAAISCMVTFLAQQSGQAVRSMEAFPITVRIANSLTSYVAYVGKTIWPANLTIFYPHPGDALPIWKAAGAGLLLLFISMGALRAVKRYPYFTVGWLWYLGTLVPVIGLVQVGAQALADRYTYVPLIGLFISIAWGAHDLLAKYRYRTQILAVTSSAIISSLLICTWSQVSLWKNPIKLFTHSVRVTANNWLAHNNLGVALVNLGKLDEATSHFFEAVRIKSNYAEAYTNLGNVFAEQGKLDKAVAHFSQVLRAIPDSPEAHNNLAVVLGRQGRYEEATYHYSEAARLKPDSAAVHNNLGVALANSGKLDEAISHYVKAVQLKPYYAEAYNNHGSALADQGKLPEAIFYYSKSLEINPHYAKAHNNLGIALAGQGRLQEAINHFQQALRINPDYSEAHNSLGTLLLSQRKLDEAIYHYRRVLDVNPDLAVVHNNLGVALAYRGRFDEAISHFRQAVQLEPEYVEAQNNLRNILEQAPGQKDPTDQK